MRAVLMVSFLFHYGASRPQSEATDRPQPNRPFYRPNPTYELISQLIPPGEPWPANAGDYGSFSQTKPPNYTPLWAGSSEKPPPVTTVVNLEDRIKETDKPVDFGWFWPEEQEVGSRLGATEVLFTSAPAATNVRIDEDEPKLENVVPVNLIPDVVTVKSPRATQATTKQPARPVYHHHPFGYIDPFYKK